MGKLSQKAFDSQLHIIRDVHFDVDKYKVGELYVINNTLEGIVDNDDIKTVQGSKVIGQLVKANRDSLIFEVPVYFKDPNTGGIYSFEDVTLSIDTIINYRIEIERLLTETEAAVYLSMAVLDEVKQSTLDPADPKFNRLLGIVPDYSQFPYTLERTHSYQELQAAYKIDEETAKECVDFGQIAKDLVKEDESNESPCDFKYAIRTERNSGVISTSIFSVTNGLIATDVFKGLNGTVKITLIKAGSEIVMYTSCKNIKANSDAIEIRNRNGTVKMKLMAYDIRSMFDKIIFEDQQ